MEKKCQWKKPFVERQLFQAVSLHNFNFAVRMFLPESFFASLVSDDGVVTDAVVLVVVIIDFRLSVELRFVIRIGDVNPAVHMKQKSVKMQIISDK